MLLPMLGACFVAMLVPMLPRDEPIYESLRELTSWHEQAIRAAMKKVPEQSSAN
jgi:CIC family chloride channel protein